MISHPKHTGNKLQKMKLLEFWGLFGGGKCEGVGYSIELKLAAVIQLSEIVIEYKKQQPLSYRRDRFKKIRHSRHSLVSHGICFICSKKAEARHHLIQLQNGGLNSKRNLISVCNSCHGDIHPWLKDDAKPSIKSVTV